jgi:hypothetical protein
VPVAPDGSVGFKTSRQQFRAIAKIPDHIKAIARRILKRDELLQPLKAVVTSLFGAACVVYDAQKTEDQRLKVVKCIPALLDSSIYLRKSCGALPSTLLERLFVKFSF